MENEFLEERYNLAIDRIRVLAGEQVVVAPYRDYFQAAAKNLLFLDETRKNLLSGKTEKYTLEQWQEMNRHLYEDILPDHYDSSYANPTYAKEKLGDKLSAQLCFLYSELSRLTGFVFENRLESLVVYLELFLEIYNVFEQEGEPSEKAIREIIYWFMSDYCDVFVADRVRDLVDPERNFALRLIEESDLSDLRYLYRFGEYITENELRTAEYLNSLPEETIAKMADTYTEGYRIGFVHGGKDLSKKKTVDVRYHLGFERMIRKAVENFRVMGLEPTIYRHAATAFNRRGTARIGFEGAVANPQFDYDHREDSALFLDRKYMERRLGVMHTVYEELKEKANGHAGPAVVETFGEDPFVPKSCPEACRLDEKQQKLLVEMNNEAAQLTNQYIIGKERSFTIIAFPLPSIDKERFPAIFSETIRINTLNYELYQRIQQNLIDALDQGTTVHIQGMNGNETDFTVALAALKDPSKESIFENCVADVNIPVGEVFTSPKLTGTNGILHVTQVFLNELKYKNLKLTFKDGKIEDYSCSNFATEEENRHFIEENLLFHHETLPLGEFAIGTNTTAYAVAEKYQIQDRFPILIAEKMGPHFAVGDTCYSWEEDTPVYNPDGKEIIARDNEISLLRHEDPSKAYFGCHTDITIPYRELGLLEVIHSDGTRIPLIKEGRFVLHGTEELNEGFEDR